MRNIRQELKAESKVNILKNYIKIIKYIFSAEKIKTIKIFVINILLIIEPIISLFILQQLINDAINKKLNMYLIVSLLILKVIQLILKYINDIIKNEYQQNIVFISKLKVHKKITDLRIKELESKEIYNNYERAKNSVKIFSYFVRIIIDIIFGIIRTISYFILIVIFNYKIAIGLILFLSIFYIKKAKVLKENYIQEWEFTEKIRKEKYYEHVLSEEGYIKETKLLNKDKDYLNLYINKAKENREKIIKLNKSDINSNVLIDSSSKLTEILFTLYLLYSVVYLNLPIGNFNTNRTAFLNFNANLSKILRNIIDFQVDSLEMREFFKFLEYETDYKEGKKDLKDIKEIEFKNVYFKYNKDLDYVLKDVSFKIKKGKNIALIGRNGSGKTTIMKLIEKVYLPSKGQILINNIDIKEYKTSAIRSNISMLLQDYKTYQESIKKNILLEENNKIEDKNVYESIRDKSLIEKIKKLPDGINTILGNWFGNGIMLSKGEMQKIALARVYNMNSNIVLLDEPNSALDPLSEKELFEQIKKDKKTAIVTLHVFTNIDNLDKVIMFDNGKIVTEGKHKELYESCNKYKKFYDLQVK